MRAASEARPARRRARSASAHASQASKASRLLSTTAVETRTFSPSAFDTGNRVIVFFFSAWTEGNHQPHDARNGYRQDHAPRGLSVTPIEDAGINLGASEFEPLVRPTGPMTVAGCHRSGATDHASMPTTSASPTPECSSRPACSGPRRSLREISAVANRRDGPTSSAVTSTRLRRSPFSVSHVCCSSRPVTTTRLPLVRLRATFSARSLQHTMSKNDVASSHSSDPRGCHRRLTARPNVAFAWPSRVYRISGSRVRLPESVVVLLIGPCSPLLSLTLLAASVIVGHGPCAGPRRGAPRSLAGSVRATFPALYGSGTRGEGCHRIQRPREVTDLRERERYKVNVSGCTASNGSMSSETT